MDSIKSAIRELSGARSLLTLTATVAEVVDVSPGFIRLVLTGEDFAEYADPRPADAFKAMLPDPTQPAGVAVEAPTRGGDGLPRWEGLPPVLRALSVRSFDPETHAMIVDVARHERGVLADWLSRIGPGDSVTFSGMRTEWHLPDDVERAVLFADPAGLPALAAILESLPAEFPAVAVVSVEDGADIALLPPRDAVHVHVVDDLREVSADTLPHLGADGRLMGWIAAETSAVRHLRLVLRNDLGVAPTDMLARAYWTRDIDGSQADAADLAKYQEAIAAGADISDPALAERISLGE
ncbi:siderophore-interacting protein [Gordonia sp. (in: high G+C Gram-positive bacteria)]|uniref:siderophore-interacting protein n=1 Tax=Gordonia sp. (in: high G+C Gram-positive bacteria) TaxID=84139 RepID=UPI003F98B142